MEKKIIKNVDEYIAGFPDDVQQLLQQLRATIKNVAPDAEEIISYQMPAFKYHGILVYFAAFKNHIGFYPMASGIATFKNEISGYKTSKGTVQFPIDKSLPVNLITTIIKFRLAENIAKAKIRKKKVVRF